MTTTDLGDIERALGASLALPLALHDVARLDARVGAAIAAPPARRVGLPALPRLRRSRGMALIAVVVVVTMAAGGVSLIDRMFRDSGPAWELAWSRAKPLGLSETVGGVTVGVERAYMDDASVVIGLTMEGYAYAKADLRVDGRDASGGGVYQVPSKGGSAAVLNFSTPPDVGARAKLELVVPYLCAPGAPGGPSPEPGASLRNGTVAHPPATASCQTMGPGADPRRIDGPWRFAFALPNAGGSEWTGSVADVASGVTITLDRLAVSPTSVVAHLHWSGDPLRRSLDDVWSATGRLEHGGEQFEPGGGGTAGDRADIGWEPGTDDPSGDWTLRIDEITSDPGYPPERIRITGPWMFKVTMPR